LCERRDDIPELLQAFLDVFARETGKTIRGMADAARHALVEYSWPGNIRELENEARRLAYLCPDGRDIEAGHLSVHILCPPPREASAPPSTLDLRANLDHLERHLIQEALARTRGKRSAAARLLGISRNGLTIKMERLGLLSGPGRSPTAVP
jgi:DNA-binding NtrC family response regulator